MTGQMSECRVPIAPDDIVMLAVPFVSREGKKDVSFVVVSIPSPYPHTTAHQVIVCARKHKNIMHTSRNCTTLSVQLFTNTKKQWLLNSVTRRLHSVLLKGAAILDCELGVGQVPPTCRLGMTLQAPQEIPLHDITQQLSGPFWSIGSTVRPWNHRQSPPSDSPCIATITHHYVAFHQQ